MKLSQDGKTMALIQEDEILIKSILPNDILKTICTFKGFRNKIEIHSSKRPPNP
jgi:hypothetical protein